MATITPATVTYAATVRISPAFRYDDELYANRVEALLMGEFGYERQDPDNDDETTYVADDSTANVLAYDGAEATIAFTVDTDVMDGPADWLWPATVELVKVSS